MAEPAPPRPPLVTRGLVLAALAATLLVQTQRISPASLALSPGLPWEQDLWRPITCLFYSDGFTVGFAVRLFLLARYSSTLETHAFAGSAIGVDTKQRRAAQMANANSSTAEREVRMKERRPRTAC